MDFDERNPFNIPYEHWREVPKQKDSEHDELTGMYTREAFYQHAREMIELKPKAKYTLIISDIDNFKMINDRYGETKGDELLAYVGACLNAMNGEHVLFARYSGDQFVGFMRQIGPVDEDDELPITNSMAMMYKYAPVDHFETKFGLYHDVDKSLTIAAMCDRAMMAVKTVKHQYGRIMAKYNQAMQAQYMREQMIEEYMEEALKNEEFIVYFQPKHDSKTEELIGAEALIRWIHPIFGFLSPAEFIPLFERNGFITRLDHYVLKKVCKLQAEWLEKGIPVVPISINVSRKDFYHRNCVEELKAVLAETGLDPKYLHMEVTESVYIEDAEMLMPIMIVSNDL